MSKIDFTRVTHLQPAQPHSIRKVHPIQHIRRLQQRKQRICIPPGCNSPNRPQHVQHDIVKRLLACPTFRVKPIRALGRRRARLQLFFDKRRQKLLRAFSSFERAEEEIGSECDELVGVGFDVQVGS